MSASALIRGGASVASGRTLLSAEAWSALPEALAAEPRLALLGLWGEPGLVHAAFLDEEADGLLLASSAAPYASLAAVRPGAALMERAARDLWGIDAHDATDRRPWLDHGRWPVTAPLSARPRPRDGAAPQPSFLPAEGEGVHTIPVGPIHAGIIEPGHFRFHVQGEAVVRLEVRLGYVHKGTLGLMRGKSPRTAAPFPARISGDSTVAHSLAFARAAEAATNHAPPPRAIWLRAAMLECERVANHLNDWGFVCNDASFAFPHARTGFLREGLLRGCEAAFGHRLMMDRVMPGGVALDLTDTGVAALRAALAAIGAEIPGLLRIYDSHASLADRVVGTGIIASNLATRYAAGGVVGRASGRGFDARRLPGSAPYDDLDFAIPVLPGGDVDARVRVRVAEIEASLGLLYQLLDGLPPGPIHAPLPIRAGEGMALVEGFRGDVMHWLRLDDGGLIEACFARDPSWFHWPLLEAAVEGDIVADFPLINKSINASYSGVDL